MCDAVGLVNWLIPAGVEPRRTKYRGPPEYSLADVLSGAVKADVPVNPTYEINQVIRVETTRGKARKA